MSQTFRICDINTNIRVLGDSDNTPNDSRSRWMSSFEGLEARTDWGEFDGIKDINRKI